MRSRLGAFFASLVISASLVGCMGSDFDDFKNMDDFEWGEDTETSTSGMMGGASCEGAADCSAGLVCSGATETCQPSGTPGTAAVGEACQATFDCALGLVCASDGLCRAPGEPGTADQGQGCDTKADCAAFLDCIDGKCRGFVPPFWTGVECRDQEDESVPLKVYFEVDGDSGEFYRLPFPNDIRMQSGLSLEGHPRPNIAVPGLGNPIEEYFTLLENDVDGFSTTGFVFFRFNRVAVGPSMGVDEFDIINIEAGSEDYGDAHPVEFRAGSAQHKYICRNWLAIGPTLGRPLSQSTTYAAIVRTGVTDEYGTPVAQDDDFKAMLASDRPADSVLAAAWDKYEPFRQYLKDQKVPAESIAAAAVFTTGSPQAKLPAIRSAVIKEPEPSVSELNVEEKADFVLYDGRLTVPFFQDGKPPFPIAADGGAFIWGQDGLPVPVAEQDVRFALTAPRGGMPRAGWPVVIYAHGTGGSHLSFVDSGIAKRLARIGMAVIGLEQVQHGDRRELEEPMASSELYSPERLFYNFVNPRAARDNNYQAAADHFQLVRLIERFSELSGEDISFDVESIFFYGHSQGTQGPFLFAAHEPRIKAVVLSGAGGYLLDSLLGKKEPVDVSQIIGLALLDTSVDRYHPMLNLVQLSLDEVDPVNYARSVFREDPFDLGYPKRHVFMSYGIGDSYTPERTQIALAKALGVKQLPIEGHEIPYVSEIGDLPYSGGAVTAAVVQYIPDGDYDAHFVMTRHPAAIAQTDGFLETLIGEGKPAVIPW